jgi:hypothetical protein
MRNPALGVEWNGRCVAVTVENDVARGDYRRVNVKENTLL